ncbi:hypothetical protein GCM10023354_17320 [Garicola koreensis]
MFAVQTATNHREYDALSVSQWKFYVMPRGSLQELGSSSVGLPTLDRRAGPPIAYADLATTIRSASLQSGSGRN